MSAAPGARRRSNREERRLALGQRLLETVERLSAEGESFTAIGVERIAADAGIGRSTFYLYFQDKSDLLEFWYAPIAAEIEEAYERWFTIDATSTEADFRGVVASIAATHLAHASALAIVFDATAYDQIVRELVDKTVEEIVSGLAKHIRLGQRQGWIASDLLPRETATWLTWMGQRGGHQLLRLTDEKRLDDFIDGYCAVVWRSIYADAPGRGASAA